MNMTRTHTCDGQPHRVLTDDEGGRYWLSECCWKVTQWTAQRDPFIGPRKERRRALTLHSLSCVQWQREHPNTAYQCICGRPDGSEAGE